MHLKSQMQYKTSFFLTLFGNLLVPFTVLLGLYFLMNRFSQVDGFSLHEVLLCFASVLMALYVIFAFSTGGSLMMFQTCKVSTPVLP